MCTEAMMGERIISSDGLCADRLVERRPDLHTSCRRQIEKKRIRPEVVRSASGRSAGWRTRTHVVVGSYELDLAVAAEIHRCCVGVCRSLLLIDSNSIRGWINCISLAFPNGYSMSLPSALPFGLFGSPSTPALKKSRCVKQRSFAPWSLRDTMSKWDRSETL